MRFHDQERDRGLTGGATDLDSLAATLGDDDEPRRRKPLSGWWILGFVLVGVLLSAAAFTAQTLHTAREERAIEDIQARNHLDALRQSFSNAQLLLHSIRGALHGAKPASRASFTSMAGELRRLFPSLQVIGWTPRTKVKDIPALERAAATEGLTGFSVRNADGSRPQDTLGPDEDVFPVLYDAAGVGAPGTKGPTGVNVLSLPGRAEILWRACNSGDALAASWATLTPLPGTAGSIILYLAVYDADLTVTFPYDACPKLIGVISAILRVDTLMATSFRALSAMDEDIYLLNANAPKGRRALGVYPAAHPEGAFTPLSEAAIQARAVHGHWLEVGGLELSLTFVAPTRDWPRSIPEMAWFALIGGLSLTATLAAFFAKQRGGTIRLMAEAARRHHAERALRASEYRFRMALKDSNVTVFSQDRDLRYTWIFNPTIGIEPEEFIGKRHSDLFPGDSASELETLKTSVINSGFSVRRDVRFMVRGEPHVRDLRIEPLHDRDGAITGIIAVAVDVTEARRMKEELSHAVAEAERATAAKSRFLAAASHDLRQPFQAMQLYQELLAARLTTPDQRDICRHLGASIRTGRELLTALLDVSTLDAGTITAKITAFPLGPSLENLLAEFKEQTAAVGIRLRLVRTSAVVRSDRILLERILRNLLTNAVRYTERGRILVGCRHRPGAVEIQVLDTGIGIEVDKRELIFEDFYQIGNPERRLAQGLGLGLGIVARTGRLLGHEVAVRSTPGRGSLFSVTVALAETCDPAILPDAGAEGAIPPQRILIIEDDDMQRHALRLLLEDSGHTVLTAGTAEQARDKVSRIGMPPTLIISDLRLPGPTNGVDLIRELRERIGAPVPSLLVTGDTDGGPLRHAASAGITLLHKPFNHAALQDVLRLVIPRPAPRAGAPHAPS